MLSIGKMKPDSSMVGSIVPTERAHHRHALRRRPRRDQNAERQRHENEEQSFDQEQRHAAAQRHVEDEPGFEDHADDAREADGTR